MTEQAVDGVPPRTVLRTARSCHGEGREALVLRSSEEWQRWLDRASCGTPRTEPVDFAREIVLAVGDETGPTACHSVEIVGVVSGSGGLVAEVVRHVPAKSAVCATMLVHAAHAVAIPSFAGTVRFTWRDESGGAAR